MRSKYFKQMTYVRKVGELVLPRTSCYLLMRNLVHKYKQKKKKEIMIIHPHQATCEIIILR
jgi:hypothetical protein